MIYLEGTDKEVYHRGINYVSKSLMKNKSDVPGHSFKVTSRVHTQGIEIGRLTP